MSNLYSNVGLLAATSSKRVPGKGEVEVCEQIFTSDHRERKSILEDYILEAQRKGLLCHGGLIDHYVTLSGQQLKWKNGEVVSERWRSVIVKRLASPRSFELS